MKICVHIRLIHLIWDTLYLYEHTQTYRKYTNDISVPMLLEKKNRLIKPMCL